MSNIPSEKFIERENRLKRIKEAKELDKQWSKQVVQANRENEYQRKQQEEYKGAIEQYKNILMMIDELKKDKEMIIKKQEESKIENEMEQQRQYENMLKMEEKKKKFEIFLKQKGIEASNYLKDMEEEKRRQHEEIHRFEKKKQTKIYEDIKTKKVIDNYLIKKEKEIYEEKKYAECPGTMDVLYKITNPFHNNGNKIDYSTTRFHNVTIERHDNNLNNNLNFKVNAFERAKIESENTKKILNEKSNKLKEFKKNEKMNFREQINKNRAKENMEKLKNEIKALNKFKKKEKNNSKKRIDINANLNNAKQNERKAKHFMNKLLENQKGNRSKNFTSNSNNLEIVTNGENDEPKATEDSLNNFYKEKNDNEDIINQNIMNKINPDKEDYMEIQTKKIKKYEEPISRDKIPKNEVINRLSPVDLPSYQKVEIEQDNEYEHKIPEVKSPVFILSKKNNKNCGKYYLGNLPEKKNDFNLLNELQMNNNVDKGFIDSNDLNDVKMFINQINSCNQINNDNVIDINNNNDIYQNNNLIQDNIRNDKNENVGNEDISQKKQKEEKDKKWKYNKKELYERKKKMLKDKSNFK